MGGLSVHQNVAVMDVQYYYIIYIYFFLDIIIMYIFITDYYIIIALSVHQIYEKLIGFIHALQ